MGIKIFILLLMLFMHIVDDYYLQGWLASAKQKVWWENNAPKTLYKNDYKMALGCHAFSWTFMIMLPLVFYVGESNLIWLLIAYPFNLVIHCFVDNLKANKLKINLITDQTIHILQVIITWSIYIFIF